MTAENLTIYHNPRCSKSRETLDLIQAHHIHPNVILYLDTPPTATEIRHLLSLLGFSSARDLMRKKEDEYLQLGLDNAALTEDQLIQAMVTHPRLIERPIVVYKNRAEIGRPPEKVLTLLE